jgi:hypothetical protein
MNGANLKFDPINTPQAFEQLRKYGETFNHEVRASKYPLIAFRMGDRPWHGYCQVYGGPLIFSSWHTDPKICSPRDVVETFKGLAGWMKLQHGGGFAATAMGNTNFTPEIMAKFDFARLNMEIYETLA